MGPSASDPQTSAGTKEVADEVEENVILLLMAVRDQTGTGRYATLTVNKTSLLSPCLAEK
jgi:hypothetical protein